MSTLMTFLLQNELVVNESELELLERIEAPDNLRGFAQVDVALREMSDIFPRRFSDTFSLTRDEYKEFSLKLNRSPIAESRLYKSRQSSSKDSWKSSIPIYSLLFKYRDFVNSNHRSKHTLDFLNHYWKHYDELEELELRKNSAEKFRLLCTDNNFDSSILSKNLGPNNKGEKLSAYSESLSTSNKKISSYARVLSNFYLLSVSSRVRLSIGRDRYEHLYNFNNLEQANDDPNILIPEFKKNNTADTSFINSSEEYGPTRFAMLTSMCSESLPYQYKSKGSLNRYKIKHDVINITNKIERAHNHSILSRSIIQFHKLDEFLLKLFQDLNKDEKIAGVSKRELAKICLIKLYSGLSDNEISALYVIGENDTDGIGFLFENEAWYLRIPHTKTAQANNLKGNINNSLGNIICIGIPSFLINALDLKAVSVTQFWLQRLATYELRDTLTQYLKHTPVSITQVENFAVNFNEAYGVVDPVVFDFAFNRTTYRVRAKRHYIDYSAIELSYQIEKFWHYISKKLKHYGFQSASFIQPTIKNKGNYNQTVGSYFMPKLEQLSSNQLKLQSRLRDTDLNKVRRDITLLIQYHNDYTAYVSHMLIQGTGYRAVYSPLPSFSLINERHKLLYISDKDSNITFHHSRVIALPNVVVEQIKLYKKHLVAIANFLSLLSPKISQKIWIQLDESGINNFGHETSDAVDWFLNIKNSRGNNGCLFYIKKLSHIISIKNISPDWLNTSWKTGELNVNIQSYRHFVRGYLTKKTSLPDELVSFQMGHGAAGEMPLSINSANSYLKSTELIRENLNLMMESIGWSAEPSILCINKRSL